MSVVFYTFAGPGERYQAKLRALVDSALGARIRANYPWIFIKAGADRLRFDGEELLIPRPEGYGHLGYKMLAMLDNFLHSPYQRLFRIDDDVAIDPARLDEVVESCSGWDYTGVDYYPFHINTSCETVHYMASRMPGLSQLEVMRRMEIYTRPGRNPVPYAIGAFMTLSREGAGRVYPHVLRYHEEVILDDMMLGQAFMDTDCRGLRIGQHPVIQRHVKREVAR